MCCKIKFIVEKSRRNEGLDLELAQSSPFDDVDADDGNENWQAMASIALSAKSENMLFTSVRKKSVAEVRKGSVCVPELPKIFDHSRNRSTESERSHRVTKRLTIKKRVNKSTVKQSNVLKNGGKSQASLRYLQAAQYFRENACGTIHPTSKLKCVRCRMIIYVFPICLYNVISAKPNIFAGSSG